MSQYRPSIGDLLITVQQLLNECGPKLRGEGRYHALVGSYLLGICERELRLSSDFDGPFNFNLGANFLRYDTEDKYYVFINSVSLYGGVWNEWWLDNEVPPATGARSSVWRSPSGA